MNNTFHGLTTKYMRRNKKVIIFPIVSTKENRQLGRTGYTPPYNVILTYVYDNQSLLALTDWKVSEKM